MFSKQISRLCHSNKHKNARGILRKWDRMYLSHSHRSFHVENSYERHFREVPCL